MVCAIQICCLREHTHALTHIRLRTRGNKKTYVHRSYKQIYIYIIWPLLFFFILAWFSCPLCRFLFRTIATIHVYKNPVTTITTTCNVLYILCLYMKFIRHEVLDVYIYMYIQKMRNTNTFEISIEHLAWYFFYRKISSYLECLVSVSSWNPAQALKNFIAIIVKNI